MSDAEAAESDEERLFWSRPPNARRYHIFDGEPGVRVRSLCGKWRWADDGGEPEVDPEDDTFGDGEDCKTCARKAGVLEDDDA